MSQQIGSITTKQILELLEQQQYKCALSGWQLTPETASIDHTTPLSRGGDHLISNAQIVDWRVNAAKGTMTNEEFIEMCRAVVANAGDCTPTPLGSSAAGVRSR